MPSIQQKHKRELIELKQRQEEEIDQQFRDQYPEGLFLIQRYTERSYSSGRDVKATQCYGLHWSSCRRGSYSRTARYLSTIYNTDTDTIKQANTRSSNRGKTTQYASLDRMIAAAGRFELPQVLVDAFVERYNNRVAEWLCGLSK